MLITSVTGVSLINKSNEKSIINVQHNEMSKSGTNNPWWDTNWKYRKQITIDHTKVAGDITYFPILIRNTSLDFTIHAQPDGDDFVFTTLNGVKLNHEIESYNPFSGEFIAWVNMSSLSTTENTEFFMYYGNANCSNQQDITETWNSNYSGVWHLKETSGTRYDSTSNGLDCTASGTTHTTSARIDGGEIYDASYDMIYTNSNINSMSTYTMECWVTFNSSIGGTGDTFMFMPVNNPAVCRLIDNKLHVWLYVNQDVIASNHTFNDTDWHYVVLVATDSELQLFVDSILEGIYPWADICYSNPFYLGDNWLGTDTFTGTIDEARISNCARNISWINTSYNSMSSPEIFMDIGEEEIEHYPPVASFTYTINELSVTFNATSSYDPDGNITTWLWDFGDGAGGTGEIITYNYLLSGTYNVTLTVVDNDGYDDSNTQEITVEKIPEFQKAFIFGKITNLSSQGDYISFEAVKTRVVIFSPFSFSIYVSGEKFTISKEYKGLIGIRYIFACCKMLI